MFACQCGCGVRYFDPLQAFWFDAAADGCLSHAVPHPIDSLACRFPALAGRQTDVRHGGGD